MNTNSNRVDWGKLYVLLALMLLAAVAVCTVPPPRLHPRPDCSFCRTNSAVLGRRFGPSWWWACRDDRARLDAMWNGTADVPAEHAE